MVDPAPHGAGASPGNRSRVICSGSQFSFKLPKIRLQTQFFLSLLNFLLIQVKLKEKMPHINLLFSLTIHDRTQLQIFEFKFFTKSIFLSHFQIHRIRIRNSGFESGFGRGSGLMRIRIHNTDQLCGIVTFPSIAPDMNFLFSRSSSCFSSSSNPFYLKYSKNTSTTQQKP